jgi:hypothetical protein
MELSHPFYEIESGNSYIWVGIKHRLYVMREDLLIIINYLTTSDDNIM